MASHIPGSYSLLQALSLSLSHIHLSPLLSPSFSPRTHSHSVTHTFTVRLDCVPHPLPLLASSHAWGPGTIAEQPFLHRASNSVDQTCVFHSQDPDNHTFRKKNTHKHTARQLGTLLEKTKEEQLQQSDLYIKKKKKVFQWLNEKGGKKTNTITLVLRPCHLKSQFLPSSLFNPFSLTNQSTLWKSCNTESSPSDQYNILLVFFSAVYIPCSTRCFVIRTGKLLWYTHFTSIMHLTSNKVNSKWKSFYCCCVNQNTNKNIIWSVAGVKTISTFEQTRVIGAPCFIQESIIVSITQWRSAIFNTKVYKFFHTVYNK